MDEGDFLVERYRLIRKLGKGAMGQVWLAHDQLLNRHVAVKHLLTGSQESLNAEFVQRAMREARLAAQLNHPNAVQIYDLIMSDGMPHVVMEYVDGETLAHLLEGGPMTPQILRPVIRQVAAALSAAHDLGIVHRDVKPANILVATNGTVKLADFGIARASHDANLTITGLVIGTLAYMAPEVGAGDPATPASDVWSLGATAYSATEGRAPFAGESSARMLYRKVSEPPPVPTGAGELTDLLRAMMATEPAQRPAAQDVARALEGSGRPNWTNSAEPPEVEPTTVLRVAPGFGEAVVHHPGRAPEPTTVRTPPPEPQGWTEPRRPEPTAGRGGLIAAVIVVALVIAGGVVALVLTSRSGQNAAAGSSRSIDTSPAAPATVTVTTGPPSTTSTSSPSTPSATPTTSAATSDSASGLRSYVGPNGLAVDGPASWDNPCPGADGPYYWCAGAQGFLGGYFRLRLKTAHTASLATDVQSEVDYFRSTYSDGVVQRTAVAAWPVSADAVDLVYTFTNSQGLRRKGIERVFTTGGSTLIIATTGPRADWPQTLEVFDQLTGSAHL